MRPYLQTAMGSFMLQVNRALNPVTLIDTKHHKVGALELTLSEAIPFISSPLVRLPLTLPRQLIIPWWGLGGREERVRTLVGLIKLCLLLVTWFWATYVILLSLCFLTYKMGHSEIGIT